MYLPVYLPVYLSVYLPACLSAYLPVYLVFSVSLTHPQGLSLLLYQLTPSLLCLPLPLPLACHSIAQNCQWRFNAKSHLVSHVCLSPLFSFFIIFRFLFIFQLLFLPLVFISLFGFSVSVQNRQKKLEIEKKKEGDH